MTDCKVAVVNLEYGNPTVSVALMKMKNALLTYKKQGVKAVIFIHGYGSSGVGGSIKTAVRAALSEPSLSGLVKTFAGGEQWPYKKREMLSLCKSLQTYEPKIFNNDGITVVILK
jgi:hypothetical protein